MMTSILVKKKKEYSKPPNCHVYHTYLKKWKLSNINGTRRKLLQCDKTFTNY